MCGSWAGRKRLVAAGSGGAVLMVRIGLYWWAVELGNDVCGQMGPVDVVGGGREAGRPRHMVGPWRMSTRKPKRAKEFTKRRPGRPRLAWNVSVTTSMTPRRFWSSWAAWQWSTSGSRAGFSRFVQRGERRRHEHRQVGAAAVSRMLDRGEMLTAIAELAGVKVSEVRTMLKTAGAQPVGSPDSQGALGPAAGDAALPIGGGKSG
jgi:hypothetical protein